MKLYDLVRGANVLAFLGMCKNAGKTTAMNRLLEELAETDKTAALTSIGRDGEGSDLVTGTEKPSIYMRRGMLAATASGLLNASDVSREILEVTDMNTPLGPIVIFRARSDGYVQLAGPSIMKQMNSVKEMLCDFGADMVMIDGALNRRSPLSGALEGACILSTGASYNRDMLTVVKDTAYIYRLLSMKKSERFQNEISSRYQIYMRHGEIKEAESQPQLIEILKKEDAAALRIGGALTDTLAKEIIRCGKKAAGLEIVIDDGSKALLAEEHFEKMRALDIEFGVINEAKVSAVTVNPWSAYGWNFGKEEFLQAMTQAVDAPVIDVEGGSK